MKRFFVLSFVFVYFAYYSPGQNSPPVKVRALKDNTNLRAKPALNVEVVGQVSANQELTIKSMDAEWVEVVAPTNIDFWVLGDYLKDGVVVCRQMVNVRAGPGINFSVVGQLANGAKLEVRGSLTDWIKVAPPEGCSLWVARPLVEIVPAAPVRVQPIKPPAVEPAAARAPDKETSPGRTVPAEAKKQEGRETPRPAAVTNAFPASKPGEDQTGVEKGTTAVKPPADLDLIQDVGQGQWKQYEGVLRAKNFLVRSPSSFRLVAEDQDGSSHTLCFVKGNYAQLNALLFRELIISGRQYWVRRHSYPVLVPEKIILK